MIQYQKFRGMAAQSCWIGSSTFSSQGKPNEGFDNILFPMNESRSFLILKADTSSSKDVAALQFYASMVFWRGSFCRRLACIFHCSLTNQFTYQMIYERLCMSMFASTTNPLAYILSLNLPLILSPSILSQICTLAFHVSLPNSKTCHPDSLCHKRYKYIVKSGTPLCSLLIA